MSSTLELDLVQDWSDVQGWTLRTYSVGRFLMIEADDPDPDFLADVLRQVHRAGWATVTDDLMQDELTDDGATRVHFVLNARRARRELAGLRR